VRAPVDRDDPNAEAQVDLLLGVPGLGVHEGFSRSSLPIR